MWVWWEKGGVVSVVREQIASFVFVLLRNAEEKDCREQLSRLMSALVADTFDELFVISLLIRLPQLVADKPDMIQAVSIPQYMLYLLSTRNNSTTLCWAVKYAMLQLLDHLFGSTQVAANFSLSSDLNLSERRVVHRRQHCERPYARTGDEHLHQVDVVESCDRSLGTSLSRVHQSVFTPASTAVIHSLFGIIDFYLLEAEPEVRRARQDMLCRTSISLETLLWFQ